jgi:tetratricopeptide (TPR) repeat protein
VQRACPRKFASPGRRRCQGWQQCHCWQSCEIAIQRADADLQCFGRRVAIAAEALDGELDTTAHQQRVAPFRVRRLERQAREAIDAGKPFAALAACDRALAYAPDHPDLLALVAEAERAAGEKPRITVEPAAGDESSRATRSPVRDEVPAVAAAPSEPTRKRRPRWPWLVVAAGGIIAGAAITFLVTPDRSPARSPDPWAPNASPAAGPTVTTTSTTGINDGDRALMHDFLSVFDHALAARDSATAPPPAPDGSPTTARGWLHLASSQQPAQAAASVRHALALSPDWVDAQVALCVTLAAADDDGAIGACDVALRRKPNDPVVLAGHGAAYLHAGKPATAITDFDRLIAVDPDPRWRRLRAHAKTAAGDSRGAAHDLASACQLGDAPACKEAP